MAEPRQTTERRTEGQNISTLFAVKNVCDIFLFDYFRKKNKNKDIYERHVRWRVNGEKRVSIPIGAILGVMETVLTGSLLRPLLGGRAIKKKLKKNPVWFQIKRRWGVKHKDFICPVYCDGLWN